LRQVQARQGGGRREACTCGDAHKVSNGQGCHFVADIVVMGLELLAGCDSCKAEQQLQGGCRAKQQLQGRAAAAGRMLCV
jgi:hypothetical protein